MDAADGLRQHLGATENLELGELLAGGGDRIQNRQLGNIQFRQTLDGGPGQDRVGRADVNIQRPGLPGGGGGLAGGGFRAGGGEFVGNTQLLYSKLVAVWVVLAAVFVAASLLASAAIDAVAGAAGVGIGVYFLLALLSIVPQFSDYTPAGLIRVTTEVATGTQQLDATLWWPVGTGMLLTMGLIAAAVLVFRRREI